MLMQEQKVQEWDATKAELNSIARPKSFISNLPAAFHSVLRNHHSLLP